MGGFDKSLPLTAGNGKGSLYDVISMTISSM